MSVVVHEYVYDADALQALLDSLFTDIKDIRLAMMRADVVRCLNKLPYRERAMLVYKAQGYSDLQVATKLRMKWGVLKEVREQAFNRLLVYVNLGERRQLRKVA